MGKNSDHKRKKSRKSEIENGGEGALRGNEAKAATSSSSAKEGAGELKVKIPLRDKKGKRKAAAVSAKNLGQ